MTNEEALERWSDLPAELREKNEQKWDELELDDVARERRRKLVIQAYDRTQQVDPETGLSVFGGAQPGSGRPRKKRVAQMIAEKAQSPEGSRKVITRLWQALDSDDERVRLRAIGEITRIETKDEELQQRQQELDDKPKDELIKGLASVLSRLQAAGQLEGLPVLPIGSEVIEGTIVDDGDSGAGRAGREEVA